MTDPNCTYAVVDMSQKKKNRPLAKKEPESAYYSVPPEYSLVTYDPDSEELPATAVTATNEDYRKHEKSATASSRNPEPVSTTSAASVRDKIVWLTQFLSDEKSRKLVFCAIAIALTVIALAIIIFSCIGALFTEIGKLESKIEAQQMSSDDSGQNQLAQQASNISLLIAEQDRLTQELRVNLTQISANRDHDRHILERVMRQLMDQQILLNSMAAQQSSFEDHLFLLNESLRESEQDFLQFQKSTLDIIYMMIDSLNQNVTELKAELETVQFEVQLIQPGHSDTNPASSCAALPPFSPSGYYWVRASNGSAVRVYCDMTRSCGNITGGWMRVAELNWTNSSQQCPDGFMERRDNTNTNIRACVSVSSLPGCSSGIEINTFNINYTRVCGRVLGYQIGGTNAFAVQENNISSYYVDGVSLTHGNPRQHIWTFAAARDETMTNQNTLDSKCPCILQNSEADVGNRPPEFVGEDYFCDTGSADDIITNGDLIGEDPLWDGAGCGSTSTCCSFNTPPWFYKQLPQPTTDNIEMRVCKNEDSIYEDVAIKEIGIYIQ